MNVYIMRGIPGAGKSTWINQWFHDHPEQTVYSAVLSTDHYFNGHGTKPYEFNSSELPRAHDLTLSEFVFAALDRKYNNLFVDNTNINEWEVAAYYRVAECMGHSVKVVNIWCDADTAKARNVHNVPHTKIEMMWHIMNRGLRVGPPWWKFEQVHQLLPTPVKCTYQADPIPTAFPDRN